MKKSFTVIRRQPSLRMDSVNAITTPHDKKVTKTPNDLDFLSF
jgi:hypothetical protein